MGQRIHDNSNDIEASHRAFMAGSVINSRQHTIGGRRLHGRAAGLNPAGRFEPTSTDVFDDGWETMNELSPFPTEVMIERPRKAITSNQSPDIPFERSINPYRGCEHGCIYCFARPTHAYMGHSAGLDFETKLYAKSGIASLLEREISKKGYVPKPIAIGTNTDPYQPTEKKWRLMREILEVLDAANHPVTIVTKSALILRDTDILERMAEKNLVRVAISITTLDNKCSRSMEPRASSPHLRLKAIHELSNVCVPVSVMVAPVIPALNDHEIERILDSAASVGAVQAGYILLRLPREVSPLFRDWLLRHYPDRYRHVMNLIRSMRDGKDYDSEWHKRLKGSGPYAWQIKRRFELACKKLGLARNNTSLNGDIFHPPSVGGEQLSLL